MGRVRLTRLFVLVALAALLAPRAEASRTGVWKRNPPASLTKTTTAEAGLLASLEPAAQLDTSPLANAEAAEPQHYNLGVIVLVERGLEHEEHFDLGPLTLVDLNLLRGPPPSYPETRVGGFELLPPFRVGASPSLSLWPRQACGFSCREVASDSREDPWGLKTFVNPSIGAHDVFSQVNLESGNEAVDLWLLSPINNTLNALGGLGNTATNILGIGDDAVIGALRAAGASDADIEFLRLYMIGNPGQVAAVTNALRVGAVQGRTLLGRFLERLREARASSIGMSHPERGAWVPGGARRPRRPMNYRHAGYPFPRAKLSPELQVKYPNGVVFKPSGHPDFSPYSVKTVPIKMTGDRPRDFKLANEAAGLRRTPEGYTWHHVEDGTTMQLVPTDLHEAVRHSGGVSEVKRLAGGS